MRATGMKMLSQPEGVEEFHWRQYTLEWTGTREGLMKELRTWEQGCSCEWDCCGCWWMTILWDTLVKVNPGIWTVHVSMGRNY